MAEISRTNLFRKLNHVAYNAIEGATVFCKLRGNPYVELAHWLHQVLALQDSDLHRILREFELDPAQVSADLTQALDRLPRGSTSITDLSSHVDEVMERAFVYGTLMFGESQVRTGYVLIGALKTRALQHALLAICPQFRKINADMLCDRFGAITSKSPEQGLLPTDRSNSGAAAGLRAASSAMPPQGAAQEGSLQRFTTDLTERARKGEIDPVTGRDDEIRQVVDILMRRRQNNPILVGEAGVGKTAIAEGFAQRIARGDVPPALQGVVVRTLDVGLLQAGASMKGEFEERLRCLIEEVQSSTQPVILFIDEAHTLIGAGGTVGTGDAANLLKPALARGTLRTVAATTWAEYKKYIEKDPALTRRFQVIDVAEPTEASALCMMRGLVPKLEQHHGVLILDEALATAVRMSHRYIPARQLPDKAVSLLDTACARVSIGLHAVPAPLEDCRRRIESLGIELDIIGREQSVGIDGAERMRVAKEQLRVAQGRLADLESRWKSEKALVDRIRTLRAQLWRGETAQASSGSQLEELHRLQARLAEAQGEEPLVAASVDAQVVATVVESWTGIPVGRMIKDEIDTVLKLADTLGERVIGQRHALEAIARRVRTSRAGLEDPCKPVGVFLLAGPSGVGKTETALALAEALYGGVQNLITINMSEFQEAHTVSTLKGAPPGYVGYGEGGVLTEAVRRRPYSVVLLDEIEKAHPDVHELFFQVFDKGWMEDGEGRRIDFKNTIILLTSNAGSDLVMRMCQYRERMPRPEALARELRTPLLEVFPPALLGRLVVVPYYPLSDDVIASIVRVQLERIRSRLASSHCVALSYDPAVAATIVGRCQELESGARMVDNLLSNTLLPGLSQKLLEHLLSGCKIEQAHITFSEGEFVYRLG